MSVWCEEGSVNAGYKLPVVRSSCECANYNCRLLLCNVLGVVLGLLSTLCMS